MSEEFDARDWLLESTKSLLLSVDNSISVTITETSDNRKVLTASGISENAIDKLKFIVNTDQNNHYLYLDDFHVFLQGRSEPLNIPGLKEIVLNAYRTSDVNDFLSNKRVHNPFLSHKVLRSNKPAKFSFFIDAYTALLGNMFSTFGSVKLYSVTLVSSGSKK